jgi:hypothetical protein
MHASFFSHSLRFCVFLCVLCDSVVSSSSFASEPDNPLFKKLRSEGVVVTADTKAPLPAPRMADGLDAAGQRAILEQVVGRRFTVGDFTAKIGTAPHVYAIKKNAAPREDTPRTIGVDVLFIAHGSLETVSSRDFLEDLHKKSKDRQIHILNEAELEKRELKTESSKQREERFSHGVFIVLERVELRAALRTIVTRQPDSLLAATLVDPRFATDTDFPNQWRKITIDEEGQHKLGPAHPYPGAGGYLKITRLHEPKGALFVEYHLVYTEPKGWFSGADPLTTKVPAIIQSEVRTFRQELNRIKR